MGARIPESFVRTVCEQRSPFFNNACWRYDPLPCASQPQQAHTHEDDCCLDDDVQFEAHHLPPLRAVCIILSSWGSNDLSAVDLG